MRVGGAQHRAGALALWPGLWGRNGNQGSGISKAITVMSACGWQMVLMVAAAVSLNLPALL